MSWGEFMVVYTKLIFSIARKSGLSHEDSEEVQQDTVIKTYKNINRYNPQRGTFRNWLGVIAKSCIVDQLRKNGRRLPNGWQPLADDDEPAEDRLPDTKDVFREMWDEEARGHLVEMALERLKQAVKKPRDFQVFHCSKFLEWSTDEICESLDITANNMHQINNRVGEKFEEIVLSLEKESE